jgi:hypothetical protein
VKVFAGRLNLTIRFSCWSVPQPEEARTSVRYRVELNQYERDQLTALLSGGKRGARKLKRAQILLAADRGAGDEEIARSIGVGVVQASPDSYRCEKLASLVPLT